MAVAWLLTLLAVAGVWLGVFLGRDTNKLSEHLAAAGGGLLSGISLFWLVPEVGEISGLGVAMVAAVSIAALLALLDSLLTHPGHPEPNGVVWPLLTATAVHSLLDGWSVRILGVQPLDHVAVALGLSLHKLPEGLAVGWIARRTISAPRRAFLAGASAELFTLVGALWEPQLNASGSARFGLWWTGGALSVIAGGFLFVAVHSVAPCWKRPHVMAIFLATFLLVGALTLVRPGVA